MTAPTKARLLAGVIDLGIVLAWAALVVATVLGLAATGRTGNAGPLALNLIVLVAIVVPGTIGLTLAEAGRYEATPGKLVAGLRVRTVNGERLGWPRSLWRNLLKFGLPLALGQVAVLAVFGGGGLDAWLAVVVASAVPVAYLAGVTRPDGRTGYDQLAGTTVIGIAPGRRYAD